MTILDNTFLSCHPVTLLTNLVFNTFLNILIIHLLKCYNYPFPSVQLNSRVKIPRKHEQQEQHGPQRYTCELSRNIQSEQEVECAVNHSTLRPQILVLLVVQKLTLV